jgi:hypothetical protein
MATLSVVNPTLLDLAKISDPDGKVATVVEILNQNNEILDDMSWQEGNLPTGHRTTIRSGLPAPTWRKLYGGVQPNKGTTVQVTDSCGMLEAYAEVDKALADLNGNTAAYRLSEDRAHIEGMNQELSSVLFLGNETIDPEKFTGFGPRYNSLSAANAENIIDGLGVGTDNTSIWLVVWGPNTVHGIIPKNSKAGIQVEDKGQVTIESIDGAGGRMEAYRSHYRWDAGLTLRDWRYVVRICNIDKSNLNKDSVTGSSADIVDLMVRAIEMVPNLNMGRPVFYTSRAIRSMLRRQITFKTVNSTITLETVAGRKVTMLDGIPVRRVDVLAADEARIV